MSGRTVIHLNTRLSTIIRLLLFIILKYKRHVVTGNCTVAIGNPLRSLVPSTNVIGCCVGNLAIFNPHTEQNGQLASFLYTSSRLIVGQLFQITTISKMKSLARTTRLPSRVFGFSRSQFSTTCAQKADFTHAVCATHTTSYTTSTTYTYASYF